MDYSWLDYAPLERASQLMFGEPGESQEDAPLPPLHLSLDATWEPVEEEYEYVLCTDPGRQLANRPYFKRIRKQRQRPEAESAPAERVHGVCCDMESCTLGSVALPYARAWPASDRAESIAKRLAGRPSCRSAGAGAPAFGEKFHTDKLAALPFLLDSRMHKDGHCRIK